MIYISEARVHSMNIMVFANFLHARRRKNPKVAGTTMKCQFHRYAWTITNNFFSTRVHFLPLMEFFPCFSFIFSCQAYPLCMSSVLPFYWWPMFFCGSSHVLLCLLYMWEQPNEKKIPPEFGDCDLSGAAVAIVVRHLWKICSYTHFDWSSF